MEGARAEAIVSAISWGRSPRTSASHLGTTRGVSTGPDAGARGCPISEKADPSSKGIDRVGLSRGVWVPGTRSCWANREPLTGPAPRPPWSWTVSVLVGSLRVAHICADPGASYVPVHLCRVLPRLGSRTTGSGWFLEMQTGPPEQLQTVSKSAEPPGDGVSTPLEVLLETVRRLPDWTLPWCGWHKGTSDASDSRGGSGRVAACDLSVNRLAGWYTQQSQCCPYGPGHPCPEGALWGSLRQGVLPATRGNLYANAVGDPFIPLTPRAHCTWLPSRWGIPHEYHSMPGYLLQGHSCPKGRGICSRTEGFVAGRCNLNPVSPAFPHLPRDSAMEPVLKRSHIRST